MDREIYTVKETETGDRREKQIGKQRDSGRDTEKKLRGNIDYRVIDGDIERKKSKES